MSLGHAPTMHPHDDLAVYALDALSPDERAAVDAHLATCPACRTELDRHRETLALLSSDDEQPPDHVWQTIARQLPPAEAAGAVDAGPTATASATTTTATSATTGWPNPPGADPDALPIPPAGAAVLPLENGRPRHSRRNGRGPGGRLGPPAAWLVAAAAGLVVVLGVTTFALRDGGQPDLADTAAEAAEDDGSTVIPLTTATGDVEARVVHTEDGRGYVLLDDLPDLADGQAYQLWKMNGTDVPISLGVIGDGANAAAAVGIPADTTELSISEEPESGSPTPQGPVVASGRAPA
jgi:anti-sigma-K factor RskA